ncbi:MAG: hypothetical protein QOJ40_833, partial [Verrucomicrobiota bacterium]
FAIQALSPSSAKASFSLGDAANYAVLYEGSGGHNLQINSNPLNGSTISGNIGLGNENGGNPQAQLNNPAVINGNVNFAAAMNAGNQNVGNAVINGTIHYGVASVEADLDYLNNLSTTLGALGGASLAISGSQTIQASSGNSDGSGNRLFNLMSLAFNNGSILTINGNAAGDSVVINVNAANVTGPHFAGAIVLTGGLTPDKVLINLIGGNSLTLTGGDTLQTAANNATQYATYLDPNGTINVNSVNIVGHLYGGDSTDMQIVSGATIVSPVPEPTTFIAGALLLFPLGASTLRILRRKTAA